MDEIYRGGIWLWREWLKRGLYRGALLLGAIAYISRLIKAIEDKDIDIDIDISKDKI